jgi:hypothetical protein
VNSFVVACCPARNRAWILPDWLRAQREQTRRPDALYVLLNDCADDSREVVLHNAPDGIPLVVEEWNTGEAGWDRIEPRYSTANIATLRNEMVRRVLERWPQTTHVWSVDSDVAPAPDCLDQLLSAGGVCAAVVRNSTDTVWNFMCGWDNGEPQRDGCEQFSLSSSRVYGGHPFSVSLTGACILIPRSAIEDNPTLRYSGHPRGEDVSWCVAARELGIPLYVHPLAKTKHHMVQGKEAL